MCHCSQYICIGYLVEDMCHCSQYIYIGYLVEAGLALHNGTNRQGFFLFSKPSRPVLGPTQSPIHCLLVALIRE
jgi:hypothetical protein